jgi:hypothetical protein
MPYSEWEEAMLRISLIDSPRRRRVIVEGKLIAPWVAELRNACQQASKDLHGRELIVEMKHITGISPEGENAILELINGGITFRGDGMFTKNVVKELTRRARKNLRIRERDCTGQFRVRGEESDAKEEPQ